jgi:hypothetical protein
MRAPKAAEIVPSVLLPARAGALPDALRVAGAIAGGTIALLLVYGIGAVGADGQFALLWGRQLVTGQTVELLVPYAPTPHPLTIALGALVALSGDTGPTLLSVVQFAALATAGVAAWYLVAELFDRRVGWVAVALLAVCSGFVVAAATGPQDALYVILLLVAGRLELRQPRAGYRVLWLLSAGGLVHPPAWGWRGCTASTCGGIRSTADRRTRSWRSLRPASGSAASGS